MALYSPQIVAPSLVSGLTLSNNSTNKINIAAGQCADSTGATLLTLPTAVVVDCTTTGANALDSGSLANSTTYHIFLIGKVGGTQVAGLASTSLTPTLPSGYLYSRRVGSVLTNGSAQFRAFTQLGTTYRLVDRVTNLNDSSTTTATLQALTVPTGITVLALVSVNFSPTSPHGVVVTGPAETDIAAAFPTLTLAGASGTQTGCEISVMTDTSGRVRHRCSGAAMPFGIATIGWIDML